MLETKQSEILNVIDTKCPKPTWDETAPTGAWFNVGLNLTVLGLMGSVASENVLGGEALMAPARSSEKDLKWEREGLEATGLAKTIFSASLTSIVSKKMTHQSLREVYLQCDSKPLKVSTLADFFKTCSRVHFWLKLKDEETEKRTTKTIPVVSCSCQLLCDREKRKKKKKLRKETRQLEIV